MRSARGSVLVNALLMVASVLLCLAAAEVYLILDNRRPKLEPTRLELAGRSFRFWEPAESLSDLRNAAVVVGDSFAAGEACADGRNYPAYLGKLARHAGQPYRVVNLGVPGADPLTYLQVVEGLLASGRVPSLAVVTLYSNDIELTCSVCPVLDRIRADASFTADEIAQLESFCSACGKAKNPSTAHHGPVRRAHSWLYKKLYVYAILRDVAVGLSMKGGYNIGWGRSAYPALWRDRGGLEFKLLEFSLRGIRDRLQGTGARLMVVIYPDVENLRSDNIYVGIYRDVADELSKALGVPVFSGYPAFLNSREAKPNMPFSLVDHHPSCKAHEIFAGWVFERMRSAR